MTAALAAIERLDAGTASPADRLVADRFDDACGASHHAMELQLLQFAASVCAICGGEIVRVDEVEECDTCTARWDKAVDRAGDI